MAYTRLEAEQAVTRTVEERAAMQDNLLDLDRCFGKRLLRGTQLTGISLRRWEEASRELATLWATYAAYSAVVDQAQELARGHLSHHRLDEITELLHGPVVAVTRDAGPLASRDLADSGRRMLTIESARAEMRRAFHQVAEVTSAAERSWNAVAEPLARAAAAVARARTAGARTAGASTAPDRSLAAALREVAAELDRLRAQVNADPIGASPGPARELATRAEALAARAAEPVRD